MHLEMIGQFGIRLLGCLPNLGPSYAGLLEQLVVARDGLGDTRRFANPDRQRRAPESLARKSPIDVRFQEIPESSIADMLRQPVDLAGVLEHLVPERPVSDGPALARAFTHPLVIR